MLIGLKEALDYGERYNCGIAAVNTPTLELLLSAIAVAERYGIPMILQHAEVVKSCENTKTMRPLMVP